MGHSLGSSMKCPSCCSKTNDSSGSSEDQDENDPNVTESPNSTLTSMLDHIEITVPPDPRGGNANVIEISVEEFKEITNGFEDDAYLGDGFYGIVYYGVLRNGKTAGIMKLSEWEESEEEFLQQVSAASRLRHENLSPLIAYGTNSTTHVLAFEFPGNNISTLHNLLHDKEEIHQEISWVHRVKIAVDVARGLEYLHAEMENRPRICFSREIRSASILIFPGDFSAKISDFYVTNDDHEMFVDNDALARLVRAYNYRAPERAGLPSVPLTKESEVYSFGVVLLELVTGFNPTVVRPREHRLIDLANTILTKDDFSEFLDPRMPRGYPRKTMASFLEIAAWCLLIEPESRPTIGHVRMSLENLLDYNNRPGPSSEMNRSDSSSGTESSLPSLETLGDYQNSPDVQGS